MNRNYSNRKTTKDSKRLIIVLSKEESAKIAEMAIDKYLEMGVRREVINGFNAVSIPEEWAHELLESIK